MAEPFRYTMSITGVDWSELKAALAADSFDNGRSPAQYEASFRRSHAVVFVRDARRVIGTGRILSDGVCNAYIVDIWTATRYRRAGIGSQIVRRLLATVPGQHVALFTGERQEFYRCLGFDLERDGMSTVVGRWLDPTGSTGSTGSAGAS